MAEKRDANGDVSTDVVGTSAPRTVNDGVEPGGGSEFIAQVPDSLSIEVDLPATTRETPHDPTAELVERGVDPQIVEMLQTGATTIPIADRQLQSVLTQPDLSDIDPAQLPADLSRRSGYSGAGPEVAGMLTADRLLDPKRARPNGPEGFWPRFVYTTTFRQVNIGDSRRVRERKELDARIAAPLGLDARFVPVLTRKGGVGKTTVTTLLGMALASVREDRVIAIDANPDRGTLAERVAKQTRSTVRDVVNKASSIGAYNDFSTFVSRDATRLDVLASDTDPLLSEAFDADDYNVVADLAARYYSIVLTDCGTGIVHSVMRPTLDRADTIVIVSGGSVDEARLASETLTWLEANGYEHLVRGAVVAINTATQGTNLVKLEEIEAHFASRVREIVRIPYDEVLAAGSVVKWSDLKPYTRHAARELAALVVEGIPRPTA